MEVREATIDVVAFQLIHSCSPGHRLWVDGPQERARNAKPIFATCCHASQGVFVMFFIVVLIVAVPVAVFGYLLLDHHFRVKHWMEDRRPR